MSAQVRTNPFGIRCVIGAEPRGPRPHAQRIQGEPPCIIARGDLDDASIEHRYSSVRAQHRSVSSTNHIRNIRSPKDTSILFHSVNRCSIPVAQHKDTRNRAQHRSARRGPANKPVPQRTRSQLTLIQHRNGFVLPHSQCAANEQVHLMSELA